MINAISKKLAERERNAAPTFKPAPLPVLRGDTVGELRAMKLLDLPPAEWERFADQHDAEALGAAAIHLEPLASAAAAAAAYARARADGLGHAKAVKHLNRARRETRAALGYGVTTDLRI